MQHVVKSVKIDVAWNVLIYRILYNIEISSEYIRQC